MFGQYCRGNVPNINRYYCSLNIIRSFVQINNIKSSLLPVKTGVSQGSIIGPLLFIIYLKDFTSPSDIFKIISYADDSTLSAKLSDFINRDNKKNINRLNRLSLNTSKSKFMFFYQRQKIVTIPNSKINNIDL